MIITTQRSRAGYLFDLVLTALGWFAFVYLFGAGILAILRDAQGPGLSPLPAFVPTLRTLSGYALLALANAALLVAWAVYNHRRFAGKDRRKPIKPLGDRRLAMSFGLTPAQLAELRASRTAVIHHGPDGRITGIETRSPLLTAVHTG
ncbi:poly-beta-1,6-N-acetyl-D-glucosamine biosynthesis protein PgaD [Achromobacter sp. HZ01]|uniref:Poly-beta-1,6-N-acetyl-D-glucosamine biosynthesis protein PgaD n=1 Tax=Achromobacter pulmonis TaxID=1389932 RepID=A0A2N8KQH4_9BURK|nr:MULTISPECIES: poly-beta-1,6-N-acetyl-D-glucosamine biosynthesis protein PgaD [Achromobacter]MBO9328194.1 poly-beta-1,6-N-acetyl-D-glucosamine biosynthesis protein PgaD [Achromobacter xylosoxidans]PND35670.1 poly-beta-1,6-N-acetyl-D-glucosamine biosynthesis protein PgaD [Achromobacter pulmonis]RAP65951.1 poly-beta-1,6-N-acetyl-D-glucosamine biosynthesis protein PgaD [Achromobacter sp. HZ01]